MVGEQTSADANVAVGTGESAGWPLLGPAIAQRLELTDAGCSVGYAVSQRRVNPAAGAIAQQAGCDLATVQTAPGTPSQRNVERAGFRVAYTKPTLVQVTG